MLSTTRNPYEIARLYPVSVEEAQEMVREENSTLMGWGKPHLQQYIVSRRHVDARWPREDLDQLNQNRALYAQGRVMMCQGRDGNYIIQYAIPKKHGQKS